MYSGFFDDEDLDCSLDVLSTIDMNTMEAKRNLSTSLNSSMKKRTGSPLPDSDKIKKKEYKQMKITFSQNIEKEESSKLTCIPEESSLKKQPLCYDAYKCKVQKVKKIKLSNEDNETLLNRSDSKGKKTNTKNKNLNASKNKSPIEVQQLRGLKLTDNCENKSFDQFNITNTTLSADEYSLIDEQDKSLRGALKTYTSITKKNNMITPLTRTQKKANDSGKSLQRKYSKITSTPNLKKKSHIPPLLLLSPVTDSSPSPSSVFKTSELKIKSKCDHQHVKRKLVTDLDVTDNKEDKKKKAKTKIEEKLNSWAEQVNAEFSDIEMYELEIE